MKGLKIEFGTGGADLVTDQQVEGKYAAVQNGLVNIGTIINPKSIHPTRGTELLLKGLRGELVSRTSARHAANFAALNTLVFSRQNDPSGLSDSERLDTIFLTLTSFAEQSMQLEAVFTMSDGTEVGVTPDLTI